MKLEENQMYVQRNGLRTTLKLHPHLPHTFCSTTSKFCFLQEEIGPDGVAYVFDAVRPHECDLVGKDKS